MVARSEQRFFYQGVLRLARSLSNQNPTPLAKVSSNSSHGSNSDHRAQSITLWSFQPTKSVVTLVFICVPDPGFAVAQTKNNR